MSPEVERAREFFKQLQGEKEVMKDLREIQRDVLLEMALIKRRT